MQTDAYRRLTEHLGALFTTLGRVPVGEAEVTRGEFALLVVASRLGAARTCDLAEAGGFDQSTTSRRVATLVGRGLLARTPDPDDGRAQRIGTTPAGRRVLEGERERRVSLLGRALEGWPPRDRRALADLLGRLDDSLARASAERSLSVRGDAGTAPTLAPTRPERTPA
ncbi:MarR family transcriptional regulator [Phycicoccus sp. BSK3Z-2]|uniref:MarR family transcriptional regulator n=1 Tax=Phycicoccus avicenniae TaxID=2828860 RepID=A0A941D7T5_9MICO|nr:MarR family transcriptional regulator [Phycicoccus avicenniae]MBR7743664.1 MarR family transcriptional regulator [Phycicoccus avicenniae]